MSEEKPYFAHETAVIDPGCVIGKGTKIWHFVHVFADKIPKTHGAPPRDAPAIAEAAE